MTRNGYVRKNNEAFHHSQEMNTSHLMLGPWAGYFTVRTNGTQISRQCLRADMPLVGKNSPTMKPPIFRLLLSESSCCQDGGRGKTGGRLGTYKCVCQFGLSQTCPRGPSIPTGILSACKWVTI